MSAPKSDTKAIVMAILYAADRIRGTLWDLRQDDDEHLPYEYDSQEEIAERAASIIEAAS